MPLPAAAASRTAPRLVRHGFTGRVLIRNPFSVEKMQVREVSQSSLDGSVIYRSGMNPKIQRNPSTSLGTLSLSKGFEVFTPCDFIAAMTQRLVSRKPRGPVCL